MIEQSGRDLTTWYETTQVPTRERPRLTFDLDVDVCVVGGGLAGLTVAREIARRGWSVVVLEGARVGWAASGRNSGFVLPGFSEAIDNIVKRIGLDHAKQLWALSEGGVAYVRDAAAQMRGVDVVDGWLDVSRHASDQETQTFAERLRWIGAEVEAWPMHRVRQQLPSTHYFSAVHYPRAFHLHPLNYTLGLAASAEDAGARIFEETPAISIDPAGVRKRVQTPSGMVRAAHVVLAGNVHLGTLMPRLAATLLPITAYAMVTETIEGLTDIVRYKGAVSDGARGANHYRVVSGNRLLWTGRVTTWQGDARRYGRTLARSIGKIFPQLGAVEVAQAWSGTLGRAIHRMPQVGEIQRGLWVASAFGGHGFNTTAMAGDLVARGILDNDQTWRLFAPFELVWAGGRIGKAVAQGLIYGVPPIAAAKAALARYRERSRNRAHDKKQRLGMARLSGSTQGTTRKNAKRRRNRDKSQGSNNR
jgi:gamma-glutamylputrescine oxidase